MQLRHAPRLNRDLSVIGLGTWQLGADWGDVDEGQARGILEASFDAGVTFYDTADVYGAGRSESIVGSFLADHRGDDLFVATKMGRQAALDPANYTLDAFRGWVDESRARLGVERLDLIQLHTLPTETVDADATYDALDQLVAEGAIAHYGVSVETEGQALSAIGRPNVAAVQIIVNAFRQRPLERVLPAALDAGVAIIARVPLASGLLSGKYTRDTLFAADDHRSYNRHGEKFDAGETFSGVDYEVGVDAAQEFAEYADSQGLTPATAALAWLVQLPGITTVIPGARSVEQARANAAAADVPALTPEFTQQVTALYDRAIRPAVHDRW